MNYLHAPRFRRQRGVSHAITSLLSICILALPALAQTTPPAGEEDVVELSPFTVTTSNDHGYMANSTLAGSRTNTELKDIANPLDIITKELIADMAVEDIQDLTLFANGVSPNAAGDYNSDGQEREVWNYNYMEIRGFKVGSATRNFMDLNAQFEAYNSERVEFSKGPNSILFGAGSPGGTTNYATKVAGLQRNAYSIQHRTDDLGSQRVSVDLNQVIAPDTLGLRLNALWEDQNFYRHPAYETQHAWNLTGKWKPTPDTTVTIGHEMRDSERASPRGIFAADRVSAWLDAGSPIVTAVPSNNRVVIGGSESPQSAADNGMVTMNSDNWILDSDGVLRNTRRTARGTDTFANAIRLDTVATGFDFPTDVWVGGPNGINDSKWNITEFNVTQRISDDFYIDLSYGHTDNDIRQGNSVSSYLFVDTNDFGANTHPGELYAESRPFRIDRGIDIDDIRATASYNLRLTETNKWLGDHQLAAMYEYNDREEWMDNGRLTLVQTPDGPITGSLTGGQVAFYLRDYLNLASGKNAMYDYRNIYYSDGISQDGYVAKFLRRESWAALHTLTKQDSVLAVLQSRWLQNRLITTAGWRQDKRVAYDAPFTADPVTGMRIPVEVDRGTPDGRDDPKYASFINPPTYVQGISRNYGAVFHATDWLSFTYNHATNFSPRTETRDLYGEYVKASTGESNDYGIRLSLLDNRLSLSLIHYETSELNSVTNGSAINTPMKIMKQAEQILVDNGIQATNPLDLDGNFTTADRTATGEELLLIGNPTRNWSFRLSASRLINEQRNIAPDIRAYFAERIPYYQSQDQSLTAIGENSNLAVRIEQAQTQFALLETRERVRVFPASEYNARLTAKYNFDSDSKFKGLSLGSNLRWNSAPVIGYFKTVDGVFDVNRSYKGDDTMITDVFLTYQHKLPRDIMWKVQLNIKNIFDNDDPIPVAAINDDDTANFNWVPYRYRPQDGRVFTITNTFSF
ncbi:TonB-dependent siderophore receptor [Synoicihabitans lomoniglobus]|uniref:TonB-dependent receptor plug domain-containing protein n=1 Tax=Synoicihabitans lomoniglobus TaxID=2909285 RepID=A0AAF0CNN0_9BACT|nr:TonB-dependent receptor plug domain-containing protein [Opitutaceae bacterium LMO-M01]WED64731.1 TonB-dependent receptor plug domain-containing protein [Opitutaceae bacterium LMO-M01]